MIYQHEIDEYIRLFEILNGYKPILVYKDRGNLELNNGTRKIDITIKEIKEINKKMLSQTKKLKADA